MIDNHEIPSGSSQLMLTVINHMLIKRCSAYKVFPRLSTTFGND